MRLFQLYHSNKEELYVFINKRIMFLHVESQDTLVVNSLANLFPKSTNYAFLVGTRPKSLGEGKG